MVLVCRVDERNLDVVAFVHDHERGWDRAVEGHGLKLRAVVVDDDLLLLGHEPEFHDLRALPRRLLVRHARMAARRARPFGAAN